MQGVCRHVCIDRERQTDRQTDRRITSSCRARAHEYHSDTPCMHKQHKNAHKPHTRHTQTRTHIHTHPRNAFSQSACTRHAPKYASVSPKPKACFNPMRATRTNHAQAGTQVTRMRTRYCVDGWKTRGRPGEVPSTGPGSGRGGLRSSRTLCRCLCVFFLCVCFVFLCRFGVLTFL